MKNLSNYDCTNCKACINACPKQAISIKLDEYGFAYPSVDEDKCINCSLCEKVCQKIDLLKKNKPLNSYAVQSCNYNLSVKSSSGGIFVELAHYFLARKGAVFGCAMNKKQGKFKIEHIMIEKEEDLPLLQGSKYVQSDIGMTYQEAKSCLDDGRLVLFSGTPCQIAGLKAFLKKDYNNLLCVDLSCEGVPNQKIFNDYINYLETKVIKHPIIDFKFRSKKNFGWSTKAFVALYKVNNKLCEYIIPKNMSAYFSLFIKMQILRESCYHCKFAGLNRVSDITIADAWGIDIEYPELLEEKLNIKEGVSLVLVNSQKARDLLVKIKDKIKYYPIDANKLAKYNHPLRCPSVKTYERKIYLDIYKEHGYEALERKFFEDEGIKKKPFSKERTDCLLMTMYANPNYGSILTTFALQQVIKNLGYSSKIINYTEQPYICKEFYKRYCSLTEYSKNFNKLNKISSTFILGSDNLINCKTDTFEQVIRNLFNYAAYNKKLLMFGGSMGDWDGSLPRLKHLYFKSLLKRFDYLSVRENWGKKVLKDVFDCESDWINDPIFYIDKEYYIDIAKESTIDCSQKIMKYVLYPTENTEEICKFFSKKKGMDIVQFEGNVNALNYTVFDKDIQVSDWISALINSDLVITDSFHCVAFCLMFGKKFVCIKNTRANVHFTSLFKKLNVNIPMISNVSEVDNAISNYDASAVSSIIKEIQTFAVSNLQTALNKEKTINITNEFLVGLWQVKQLFLTVLKQIFSIKKAKNGKKRKIITILGIKIKIK